MCQVDILNNERAAKDIALAKEKNAHQQGQNQRDSLRQVRSTLLPYYAHCLSVWCGVVCVWCVMCGVVRI